MTTKPKSTWGGRRRGAGPKSRKIVLREIGKVLPAKSAEEAAACLSLYGGAPSVIIALREYAKRIREANAK